MLQCISIAMVICAGAAIAQDDNIMIGELSTKQYEVAGTLYAVDEETLLIKDFNYNGEGPDAFFYIGTKDKQPSSRGEIIRYPQEQDKCDGEAKVLGAYNKQDVTLRLPKGFKISTDLKWFSVWCRQYSVNFGSVIVPGNLQIPEAQQSTGVATCKGDSGSDIVSHSTKLLYFTLMMALSTALYFK